MTYGADASYVRVMRIYLDVEEDISFFRRSTVTLFQSFLYISEIRVATEVITL